eukprot:525106-Rhodomonas_salina.1
MLLLKVSSAEQVADSCVYNMWRTGQLFRTTRKFPLTKSTPKPAFVKHRDSMMGISTLNDALVEDYDADL